MRNRNKLAWVIVAALGTSGGLLAKDHFELASSARAEHFPASKMSARQQAIHLLNRLTFGPRPGDVDRVLSTGIDKWIDQQLHPERINDSQLEARLQDLRIVNMSPRELVENYPPPAVIRAVAEGRLPMPRDPEKRAIYQAEVERYRRREQRRAGDGQQAAQQAGPRFSSQPNDELSSSDVSASDLMAMSPDQRLRTVISMPPDQRRALVQSLDPEQRRELMSSLAGKGRESLRSMLNPTQVVLSETAEAKLLRDAYSERQLQEVLTDFWFNHFNVYIAKGPDRYLVSSYERDVIRPHVLGKFKDLLIATAQSPAMLFFLDNWQSVGPNSPVAKGEPRRAAFRPRAFGRGRFPLPRGNERQRPGVAAQKGQPRGLNENYARELMELHTLGVDGGYTQKDVTEVARVFTGWTIREPRQGGGFVFNPRMHEPGTKIVLGKKIHENGEKEGLEVLEMLARHPSTARFISTKLAERFVSDDPPKALVDRMARTFLKSDGDLREVMLTMLHSPEFWDPAVYRAKVKTPLEFVVSMVRGSGADVSDALPLVQALNRMGMPLYGAEPPTGYSNKNAAWVNSAALLSRMNLALAFASGRFPGASFDAQHLLPSDSSSTREEILSKLESDLLDGDVSRPTHDAIEQQLNAPGVPGLGPGDARPGVANEVAGLIFGSPEFQRR